MKQIFTISKICPLCSGKGYMTVGKKGKTFCYCPCCEKGQIKVKLEESSDYENKD